MYRLRSGLQQHDKLLAEVGMADVHSSGPQPKDAVQLRLGPGLLQRIIHASEKGSCQTLRLEDAGGVLTVGNSQYRLGVEAGPEDVLVRVPDGTAQSTQGSLAIIRQNLCLQVAVTAQTLEREHAAAQQPESQALSKQQPLRSKPSTGKEAVPHSRAAESKGPAIAHASGAQRARSGSPPPWAHLAGPNAVFRPALGNREPTPPAAAVPPPKPSAAPATHSTAPAQAPAGQHEKAFPSTVSQVRNKTPDSAQAAMLEPSQRKGSVGFSRGGTPEPHLQSQQAPKSAADESRGAQPRQQRLPQHMSDRSHTGTPEPPIQAPKQATGQPVPPHMHRGKPPLRPTPGSSRDPTPDEARPSSRGGTPDSVNLSSSSGPSSLKTSRDNTPQPGTGAQPLSRASPLGRPGSAPTLPGAAAQVGHGPPAKVIKKARKLLGRKATAAKKTGQSTEDGRDMDIPAAALVGARKGLVYCLVGLISHRRYSSKSLTKAVAEVARRVRDIRNPSSEHLREQALKIAEYKSPGMWVLMERYQKFADELRAETDQAALPDQAAPAMSADATPEPEVPPAKKTLQSGSATGKAPAKAYNMAGSRPAKQPPTQPEQQAQLQRPAKTKSLSRLAQGEAKQVRAAAPEQHRAPSKKRAAPARDKDVEISDTDSEGEQPARKRRAYGGRLSVTPDAGVLHPTPSPSPGAAQLSEPPAYHGRSSAIAEAAHLRPDPSPTPTPAPWEGPATTARGDFTLPHSTSMPGSSPPPQLSRPQTPSELQTSHEADDTWYAEHSRRAPVRHAPVGSSEQYARYVEEYDAKHEDYLQIHQAIRRSQRYVSAIEQGYQAAKAKHEEDWYNQQADRLSKRVQPLMQHWCCAYKVLHEELQDIKDCLEEYHQRCASEDIMADD